MNDHPLISIITVSYNAKDTIEDTIKSVISQSFNNYEYIIIDGGSTDGTKEIIQKYDEHLAFWVSEPDSGIYDAMNKGILRARGEFIYFIGGDDVFMNDQVLPDIHLSLRDYHKIYYGNVLFKKRNVIYDGKFNSFKLVTRNISHQSIFYPASIFKEFQYDTRYRIFADYDLNLKLYNHLVYSFEYVPVTIALFNDEGASGSNTHDAAFEADRLKIIKTNFHYFIYLYRYFRTKAAGLFS